MIKQRQLKFRKIPIFKSKTVRNDLKGEKGLKICNSCKNGGENGKIKSNVKW